MSRRIDWERVRHDTKPKLSIKDEKERMANNYTSRWLQRAEEREAKKQK